MNCENISTTKNLYKAKALTEVQYIKIIEATIMVVGSSPAVNHQVPIQGYGSGSVYAVVVATIPKQEVNTMCRGHETAYTGNWL